MNEKIKNLKKYFKNPKAFAVIGIAGILLIFLSSFLTKSEKATEKPTGITAEDYKNEITENVIEIVKSVSGDDNPTVVVTLESGVRYIYADAGESDSTNTSGNNTVKETESSKRSYVTIKDSSGSENALIVTENMPEIRGVAVICAGGGDEAISESIKNAVTAALNINSKRVYISGGNGYEKD